MAIYLQSTIQSLGATRVHGEISDADWLIIINSAARNVISDIDPRSTIRKTALSPFLFDDIYDYTCPTDLKGMGVIDIKPQINRSSDYEFQLVTPEEFDRRKEVDKNLVSFSDDSLTRKLRISSELEDDTLVAAEMNTLTGDGGTWTLYGDGTNLTADSDYFVSGSGSVNWDISAAGGTTAGIYNDDIDTFDITDFVANGSVFVWVYITSTTNLTNFILRIGSSASAYYTKTVTTNNEGTSFTAGWNLLRFDFSSATQTGTVDQDACNYAAIYMTKAAGKISETDYRFDCLQIKRGEYHELIYISKYAWQNSSGTWLVDATASTDYINFDTEELEILMAKIGELAAQKLDDTSREDREAKKYKDKIDEYKLSHISLAKPLIQTR